jgi:hypothetical protein
MLPFDPFPGSLFDSMSPSAFLRTLRQLEIEEKILNLAALVAVLGVSMPWFGGEWFGEPTVWTGFQFYTSFAGLLVFLSHVFILSLTVLPMMGHHIIRPSLRDAVRMIVALSCVLTLIIVWSVLTNIAFDRAQMEIRFGIYLSLVGSIVVSLYAFLRLQQQRKKQVKEFFHQGSRESVTPPPPPAVPEEPRLL